MYATSRTAMVHSLAAKWMMHVHVVRYVPMDSMVSNTPHLSCCIGPHKAASYVNQGAGCIQHWTPQ